MTYLSTIWRPYGCSSWLPDESWLHDYVIKWKYFSYYWPFVKVIHRLLVDSPHKGQLRWALMFSLICTWTNSWANNVDTGYLRCHRTNYDVLVMIYVILMIGFISGSLWLWYAELVWKYDLWIDLQNRWQTITWSNDYLFLTESQGTQFSEIWIEKKSTKHVWRCGQLCSRCNWLTPAPGSLLHAYLWHTWQQIHCNQCPYKLED